MRGDSRRDLYSKALALCGLGALAGAGAVVDYWPVAVRFPSAPAPVVRDVAVPPTPRVSDDVFVTLASLLDTAPSPAQTRQTPVAPRPYASVRATDVPDRVGESPAPLPVATPGLLRVGTPVALETLPLPAFVSARQEMPEPAMVPARLAAPVDDRRLEVGMVPMADTGTEPGMLSSAFRKTGTSIVRTGLRTGTSLVDAVRVVGGAVRRAWPN